MVITTIIPATVGSILSVRAKCRNRIRIADFSGVENAVSASGPGFNNGVIASPDGDLLQNEIATEKPDRLSDGATLGSIDYWSLSWLASTNAPSRILIVMSLRSKWAGQTRGGRISQHIYTPVAANTVSVSLANSGGWMKGCCVAS